MNYFLETLRLKNETLFYYGLFCFFGGCVCLLLSKLYPIQVVGVNAWIKPFKFFISTFLMAWTMGFYMQFLQNQSAVSWYNWSLILLLSIEIFLICYQAAQGKMSHFNQEDAIGKTIFSVMAVVITLFMLHTTYIASLFFIQTSFAAPEVLVMAIKMSFIITIIFAFEGFIMGALLQHTVGAADGGSGLPVVNWSKNHGDLRVAHFFGMHALQLLPLISFLIAKNKNQVILISVLYLLLVSATLVQALLGKSFLKF